MAASPAAIAAEDTPRSSRICPSASRNLMLIVLSSLARMTTGKRVRSLTPMSNHCGLPIRTLKYQSPSAVVDRDVAGFSAAGKRSRSARVQRKTTMSARILANPENSARLGVPVAGIPTSSTADRRSQPALLARERSPSLVWWRGLAIGGICLGGRRLEPVERTAGLDPQDLRSAGPAFYCSNRVIVRRASPHPLWVLAVGARSAQEGFRVFELRLHAGSHSRQLSETFEGRSSRPVID